jgi:low affinity Fe/Cu permease
VLRARSVIDTGTTVVTFPMLFVIQHAQHRDSKAIHAKLDELAQDGESTRGGTTLPRRIPLVMR